MNKNIPSEKDVYQVSDLSNSINKIVVSRGSPFAKLMIIGEAPGAKEEEIGEPFVGRSGKLLDKLLRNSGIDINQDVYFCNVIKCRPPQNRRPTKNEIQEIILSTENYFLVTVPPLIWNGFTNIGKNSAILANCSTVPYSDKEIIRKSPYDKLIPYKWG